MLTVLHVSLRILYFCVLLLSITALLQVVPLLVAVLMALRIVVYSFSDFFTIFLSFSSVVIALLFCVFAMEAFLEY